jgi:hypothetical protein
MDSHLLVVSGVSSYRGSETKTSLNKQVIDVSKSLSGTIINI